VRARTEFAEKRRQDSGLPLKFDARRAPATGGDQSAEEEASRVFTPTALMDRAEIDMDSHLSQLTEEGEPQS
jgi:hypothetical protein